MDKEKEIIAESDYIKLADIEYKKENFLGAVEYYKKHLEKNPQDARAHNFIGHFYKKADAYKYLQEQIYHYETAIKLKPDFDFALRSLALAHSRAGNYQEAAKYFEKLLKLNPVADDYVAYACLKIRLGEFDEGWKYYEYRFSKNFNKAPYPEFEKPKWEGQNLSDKILLVQHEQGFGDSIMFFRYLEQLKPLTKKIIFRVQKELFDLFKINENGIEIVSDTIPLNDLEFDYHISIMSLPFMLNAQVNNIPFPAGYLKADKEKSENYKKEFFDNNCLKIGICWEGSALGNKRRNVALKNFYPICKLDNVKIYSFQKEGNLSVLEQLPPEIEIINLAKTFTDFSDTAAAIKNVDLFITCDNSVFNLAGAMGKKTFLLLSKDSEWRWLLDEKTTPWYNSAKIFKKEQEHQSWGALIEKIIKELDC